VHLHVSVTNDVFFRVTECAHRSKLIEPEPRERLLVTRFVSICTSMKQNYGRI